jgi:hypothetical protein
MANTFDSDAAESRRLSLQEIETGLRKLARRVNDLRAFEASPPKWDSALVDNLNHAIRNDTREIFGDESSNICELGGFESQEEQSLQGEFPN